MLSPFNCATFNHQEEDDDEPMISTSPPTPRKSSRSKSAGLIYRRHNKDSKNPYSDSGLDKFSALVADLEEKRKKIYAQMDPKDISFVRFVFKDETDTSAPVPIVIKKKHKKVGKTKTTGNPEENRSNANSVASENIDQSHIDKKDVKQKQPGSKSDQESKKGSFSSSNMKSDGWRRPSYYLPVVVIFILVLLTLSGRPFAILCTSIFWYAIPTLKQSSSSTRRPAASKKKDYIRRLSDKKMVATEGI
ncbi:uncharacterized protein LOC103942664 [Pyrus x bretschneideri]|uniref:uncharacterized protein LOC103942664 n=1 Tax=Pyrus x bretschneideri TaxID=225117 RepID=UPI00202E9FB0|nr:uncharacterized protein LOC103942664 [Pyrus x bretschneideri]